MPNFVLANGIIQHDFELQRPKLSYMYQLKLTSWRGNILNTVKKNISRLKLSSDPIREN